MKVKDVMEDLSKLPGDSDLCLSRFICASEEGEVFELTLDYPIIGTALNEESGEVRLVLKMDKDIAEKFGATVSVLDAADD